MTDRAPLPADLRSLLVEAGEALYGPRWQSDLARDLGIADRTMRRWVAGEFDIPPGVRDELRRLCRARALRLGAIGKRLGLPEWTGEVRAAAHPKS